MRVRGLPLWCHLLLTPWVGKGNGQKVGHLLNDIDVVLIFSMENMGRGGNQKRREEEGGC